MRALFLVRFFGLTQFIYGKSQNINSEEKKPEK